jgi:DNA helicase II / ATP-dependent DNA helicase PcrA
VRLGQPALVPGLTVYQAKGGEWPRVGVVLTDHENQLLANGLRELEDDHCVLYVALTRAEHLCGRLAATATLEIDQDD